MLYIICYMFIIDFILSLLFAYMYCIGIDLGTTYSCVGVYKNGKVDIIPNDCGNRITPSYVVFDDDYDDNGNDNGNDNDNDNDNDKKQEHTNAIVGEIAKSNSNAIYDVKRFIGKKYSDETVQQDKKFVSYNLTDDGNDIPIINNKYYATDISTIILKKLKHLAEDYLNSKVTHAVITVPAYFNNEQREETKKSAENAGLTVLRIINEPTASALAYGLDKKNAQTVLILDLGGGTTDSSILELIDGIFQVKATFGDSHLGGDDFDNNIIKYCLNEFANKYNFTNTQMIDMINNKKVKNRLKREAEKAKKILSNINKSETIIYIDCLYDQKDLNIVLTLNKFNQLNENEFNKITKICDTIINDASMDKKEIDDVILIGGSTRIPKIKQLIKEFFNKEPHCDINPDEAVACGASIQGAILYDKSDAKTKDIVLMDVTPISLGVETINKKMQIIIPKNTPIPYSKTMGFTNVSDNQPCFKLKIYEGEDKFVDNNNLLGQFKLTNLRFAPRNELDIKITFKIDANGILKVTAKEGKQEITIEINKKIK